VNTQEPKTLPPADETVTRRRVLTAAVGVLSALIAAVLGIPSVVTVIGRRSHRKAGFKKVAAVDSLPIGEPVKLSYSQMVENAYVRAPEMRDVWAVRTGASKVKVYSPICPHLGCRYNWNAEAHEFICPCHGSHFALDGKVLAGPAPRPLDTLPIKIESGEIYVEWELFEVGVPQKIVIGA
jgi:menaquinol-cytochrome c reductase iron-sulfur subunit